LHPDTERYQQIQQALADKGYFKGEVNGQWGDDSIDALKRFQMDQKLDDDGHLSALTLIGLGLGPKHDHDVSAPAGAAPNPPNNSVPKAGLTTPGTPTATPAATPGPPPPDSIGKD
jgi:peptidoglycan hydrolase-like protein with peptidoglycan-binding domain